MYIQHCCIWSGSLCILIPQPIRMQSSFGFISSYCSCAGLLTPWILACVASIYVLLNFANAYTYAKRTMPWGARHTWSRSVSHERVKPPKCCGTAHRLAVPHLFPKRIPFNSGRCFHVCSPQSFAFRQIFASAAHPACRQIIAVGRVVFARSREWFAWMASFEVVDNF